MGGVGVSLARGVLVMVGVGVMVLYPMSVGVGVNVKVGVTGVAVGNGVKESVPVGMGAAVGLAGMIPPNEQERENTTKTRSMLIFFFMVWRVSQWVDSLWWGRGRDKERARSYR